MSCYRRASDPVRFREPGDGDPDPPADEHADAVHEEPAQLVHQAQTLGARRLHVRRQRLLDYAGKTYRLKSILISIILFLISDAIPLLGKCLYLQAVPSNASNHFL